MLSLLQPTAATSGTLAMLPRAQLRLVALAVLLPAAVADCWSYQHPDDPRPETLDPIPSSWRRPPWGRVAPSPAHPRPVRSLAPHLAPHSALVLAEKVFARPQAPALPAVPARVCSVAAHGGKADNATLNTAAIHAAIAECAAAGGGTITLPGPGVWLSGPINMTGDHLRLVVGEGAVLRAATAVDDWPMATTGPDHPLNSTGKPTRQPFIYAQNSAGVSLSGGGVIDAVSTDPLLTFAVFPRLRD